VKVYVNKHVAHFDEDKVGGKPKRSREKGGRAAELNEVHDAIDLIGRLFRKYHTPLHRRRRDRFDGGFPARLGGDLSDAVVAGSGLPGAMRIYREQRAPERGTGEN
jgi:hypothetical protein